MAAGPSDPQIAAVAVTANEADIDAGKLATSTSHSKVVKDFAHLMITDPSASTSRCPICRGWGDPLPELNELILT